VPSGRLKYLDTIEAIRAKNNKLWMMLVRLALESGKADNILKKIVSNDQRISKLLSKTVARKNKKTGL
jgi:hypothetical protein